MKLDARNIYSSRAEGAIEVGCRNRCFMLDPRTSGITILPPLSSAVVYVVPDTTYSMMWRLRFPDGRLSANSLLFITPVREAASVFASS
jgi:hypothetical protein